MPRNLCQMAIKKRIMTAKVIGYMKPDIDPNTRLYVPFNESVGNVAKDYSQYCNHAQLTDVEWSNEGFNGAGKWNGSSSYGKIKDGFTNTISGEDIWAIAMYVKPDGLPSNTWGLLYSSETHTSHSGAFKDDGLLKLDSNGSFESATGEIVADTRYHLNFLRTGAITGEIYKNGVNIKSGALGAVQTIADDDLNIGEYRDADFGAYTFKGIINSFIVKTSTISPAQIAADCYEVVCS